MTTATATAAPNDNINQEPTKKEARRVLGNGHTGVQAIWYAVNEAFMGAIDKPIAFKIPAFRGNKNDCDTITYKDGSILYTSGFYVELTEPCKALATLN